MDVTKGSIQLVEYAHDFYRTNKTLLKLMVTRGQSKTYLKVALHASLKLDMRAPDIYSNITAFMGDRPTQKSSGEVCTDILRHVLEFQEGRDHIRDEAFCQVLKQICGNNNPESVLKGWELLMVMSSFTPCSVQLAAPCTPET